jgi:hypothetical protein
MSTLRVWDYTALREGKEVEKGTVIAASLLDAIERARLGWRSHPEPPDDWRVKEAKISVEMLESQIATNKAARSKR